MQKKLELGPCKVEFGTAGSEEDVGRTEGDVVATFATDIADLFTDQEGTQPADQAITGQKALIVCPLADITLDNLALALNQTKLQKDGKFGVPGTNLVGTLLSSKAKSLKLTKYVNGAPSTNSEDIVTFPKAAPVGNFDYSFSKSGQRIIKATFTAFKDDNGKLYFIGDKDACEGGS